MSITYANVVNLHIASPFVLELYFCLDAVVALELCAGGTYACLSLRKYQVRRQESRLHIVTAAPCRSLPKRSHRSPSPRVCPLLRGKGPPRDRGRSAEARLHWL